MKFDPHNYTNSSKFIDGCWSPLVCCINAEDTVGFYFELDLHEGAKYNWNKLKEKHPGAKNQRAFFAAYREAAEETEYRSRTTK